MTHAAMSPARSPFRPLGAVSAYAVAAIGVGIAYLLRLWLEPVLLDQSPFLLFVLPVVFTVLYAGRGPGLLAGFLALVAGFSFVSTGERFAESSLIQAGILVLVCAGVGWMGMRLTAQRLIARDVGRQLELLLEGASRYAIFMVDTAGCISSWNKGSERILGWSAGQVLGRHCSIFSPEGDPEVATNMELENARREGRFSREMWQRRSDGSEFYADVSITPIVEQDGRHLGYAMIIHDVTERRANDSAIERREQHLQSILATVPDAMIVIDEKGVMQSFSQAAERLFGYSQAEVLGRNVSTLMPSPDRERHDGYLERYLSTGVPRIIGIGRIVTGLRSDGTTFPMKLSVGEAHTADQRLFTGFVQDLTERRDFEAKLEELKSELIHVSRLSAMGTMASTLAHELNQPLTAIASFGEAAAAILEQDAEPDREMLHEVVGEMAAQSLRAGGIVRRLREFVSRGELAKTVEDLPRVIEEASALALVGTREKGLTTHFSFAPDATPVLIDRVQIQQVLINLMRNAIEAMEHSPSTRLSVATSLVDDSTVQVSVEDSGPGIEPAVREHLFEAFNSSKDAGMGLGLSICRTIVEAHGGQIRALDGENGGTEFRFTLMRPAEAPEARP
jgi:two-component system, LuxR family, sensor kinase FixL